MEISIIIPTRDRGAVFEETLRKAMDAIAHIQGEIMVVNDSKTSTPKIPDSPGVRMINNPGTGVASARNAGVRLTSGDLILFLDDDIVISRETIDHIRKLHQEMDNACVNLNWEYPPELIEQIGKTQFGRFLIASRRTSFKGWYHDPSWRDNSIFNSTAVASFHLSMKRKDFEKTSGYNEAFPLGGFEDYDFPMRLKKAGLSFWIDARVKVYHNERDKSDFSVWLKSQEARAHTRRVAVGLGYKELELHYSWFKRFFFSSMNVGSGGVKAFMTMIPNTRFFDPLFFKLMSSLHAARMYTGYMSR